MKEELKSVFKMAPIKISLLWLLNIPRILIIIFFPPLLGRAIDGEIDNNLLVLLIVIAVVYYITIGSNKYFRTRVYSKIYKCRSEEYYKKFIENNFNESLIDSRLDLVDDFPAFLETTIGDIFLIISSILVTLHYLFMCSSTLVFGISLGSVFLIPAFTYKQKLKMVRIGQEKENLNEIRLNHIKSKKTSEYSCYLSNVMKLDIKNSDIDVKAWLITNFIQAILLGLSIHYSLNNASAGSIFTTISYVLELNNYVSDIDPIIIEIKELNRNAKRLKQ